MAGQPLVCVLGPIEIVTPAGALPVGGERLRAVLATLVLGAGHAVPVDHLSWVVWGDAAPRSADNALQSSVSSLRRMIGPNGIVREAHSYRLDIGAVEIDVLIFEKLLRRAEDSRGDPAECWQLSHDALALWHGRPFGDLADDEPFSVEAVRLDELRLVAMELNIEADLGLGHSDLVLGELENAVREHPFREGLWSLLIRALALSGRRVEALRACHQLRQVLGEVGIDVGADIATLEDRILEGARPDPDERA